MLKLLKILGSKKSVAPKNLLSRKKLLETVLNIKKLKKTSVGEILSWSEVNVIHRTQHGIYQRNERLISLLTDFGKINPCYPDFSSASGKTIFYTGAGRRGDQKLDAFNRAMFAAIESGHSVPLFNKQAVGRWEFLGFWRVVEGKYIYDEKAERMIWQFVIKRVENLQTTEKIAEE